jgi:hypothetical protein
VKLGIRQQALGNSQKLVRLGVPSPACGKGKGKGANEQLSSVLFSFRSS